MKTLYIVGGGGHGRVVADAAQCMGLWSTIEFVDQRFPDLQGTGPWRVVAKQLTPELHEPESAQFIVAIGNNVLRHKLFQSMISEGFQPVNVIHPSACVSFGARVGVGSVVLANAVVNIGTELGVCTIINTSATVDHDCWLGDSVHVSPGASIAGEVRIERFAWVGIGASVRQQVTIGEGAIVGAGAAVVDDVVPGTTVLGVPAKVVLT